MSCGDELKAVSKRGKNVLHTRLQKLVAAEFLIDAAHQQGQHRLLDSVETIYRAREPSVLERSDEGLLGRERDIAR
jgi:hypothetical protein